MMGCVDLVSSCLERAERSSKSCLEGITKADMVLMETKDDSDIQCVVLVKRTELLFIAVSPCRYCYLASSNSSGCDTFRVRCCACVIL